MSTGTNIEWTDSTWNPVVGCTRVSVGCDHCYAVGMTRRLEGISHAAGPSSHNAGRTAQYRGLTVALPQAAIDNSIGVNGHHFNGEVRCVEAALPVPLRWRTPRRIFVNSMGDLFHAKVPFEFVDQVFAVMALCPQHTFQVLTKRPERMAAYLNDATLAGRIYRLISDWLDEGEAGFLGRQWDAAHNVAGWRTDGEPSEPEWTLPLPNVWLGTSIEDQKTADVRVPNLISCPAAVRFLSVEPLLGPIDLRRGVYVHTSGPCDQPHYHALGTTLDQIHWVIVGGESGPGARPCDVAWIRSIVAQCKAASVPVFVKQIGSKPRIDSGEPAMHLVPNDRKGGDLSEWPADLRVREMPTTSKAVQA